MEKIVSKVLEEICFTDFGRILFKRFWRKIVSKMLEEIVSQILKENGFKDFEGKLFHRFWKKLVSKILEESCFKDFGGK